MSNTKENQKPKTHFTDIEQSGWVARCPKAIQPYLVLGRFDRPIGVYLLLFPCLMSYTMALFHTTPKPFEPHYALPYFLFIVGAIVMRAAGCVINDLWDHNLDKSVERTATRPLASGAVSKFQALLFLACLLSIGLLVLIQFNLFAIMLGLASIIPVILYPLAKRVTYWPQFVLGLTFNWGALMGWAVMHGSLSPQAWLLYIGCLCWTIAYDTIYAYQDIEDDFKIGIKSTALLFKERGKIYVGGFYALSAALFATAISSFFALLPALHMIWIVLKWDRTSQASSLAFFKANRITGWLFVLAILLHYYSGF